MHTNVDVKDAKENRYWRYEQTLSDFGIRAWSFLRSWVFRHFSFPPGEPHRGAQQKFRENIGLPAEDHLGEILTNISSKTCQNRSRVVASDPQGEVDQV